MRRAKELTEDSLLLLRDIVGSDLHTAILALLKQECDMIGDRLITMSMDEVDSCDKIIRFKNELEGAKKLHSSFVRKLEQLRTKE